MNERIKAIRKKLGLSQTDFAERIAISRSALAKIESGENRPSERTQLLICDKFGIDPNWLHTGQGERLKHCDTDALVPRLQQVLVTYPSIARALDQLFNVMEETDLKRLNELIGKVRSIEEEQ
jgi:transcriptional regulator with XRE-family HTH domain